MQGIASTYRALGDLCLTLGDNNTSQDFYIHSRQYYKKTDCPENVNELENLIFERPPE